MGLDEGFSRRRPAPVWVAAVIAVAFLAGAVAGGLVALLLESSHGGQASTSPGGRPAARSIANDGLAQTAAFALPSVVTVINEIFPSQEYPTGGVGGGAGVIVDERGFVLTNEHIIRFPGKLTVIMDDGNLRPATLVSHDAPFTDLAVLRIPSGGLKSLPFGDSDKLARGQTVMAIGSPDVDYANSVSVGVASGIHRRKRLGSIWLDDLIQTDAAINVGNSGGPLLNLSGEVIGLISFRDIGTDDPLFGIAFALSSNSIQPIVRSIIERGSFPRPYFGIEHQDIDEKFLQTNQPGSDHGALVRRVIDGSPAQAAGIRAGDIILKIGATEINSQNTFFNALALVGPAGRQQVQVWRDGRAFAVSMEFRPR